MTLPEYFADVAKEMRLRSATIRRDFASHRPSAGGNREDLVRRFLAEHLPEQFSVDTGLVITTSGQFSNQADLVVVDRFRNAPLYGSSPQKLWPAESVYALLEVKTNLSPADIADAVAKCRRFKALERHFLETVERQRIASSLFVLWAYDSPAPETAKANILEAIGGVPRTEQPDFVVVPDCLVARAGDYLELARLGQPGSPYRLSLHAKHGSDLSGLLPDQLEMDDLGENSLMAWFVWFDSWLRRAGPRLCDPVRYLPPDEHWGRKV